MCDGLAIDKCKSKLTVRVYFSVSFDLAEAKVK
ncbi:hypothetical protein MOVI109754_02760 [Moritella viscosa]